jgi:hypothetical protein
VVTDTDRPQEDAMPTTRRRDDRTTIHAIITGTTSGVTRAIVAWLVDHFGW